VCIVLIENFRAVFYAPFYAACLGLWNRTPILQREGVEWLRDAMLGAGAIRTRFSYEDCVDMRFAEQVLREDPTPL
jgi:hypothetical protein